MPASPAARQSARKTYSSPSVRLGAGADPEALVEAHPRGPHRDRGAPRSRGSRRGRRSAGSAGRRGRGRLRGRPSASSERPTRSVEPAGRRRRRGGCRRRRPPVGHVVVGDEEDRRPGRGRARRCGCARARWWRAAARRRRAAPRAPRDAPRPPARPAPAPAPDSRAPAPPARPRRRARGARAPRVEKATVSPGGPSPEWPRERAGCHRASPPKS